MRWSLTLADDPTPPPPPPGGAPNDCPEGQHPDPDTGECVPDDETADANAEQFHALMILEDTESGDGRMIDQGALTWRELPLPLMGLDVTTEEHQEAVVIGSFTRIQRQGNEIHGWGRWATGEAATRIRGLVRDGHLRGISADLDDVEADLIFPASEEEDPGPVDPTDDNGDIVIPLGGEKLVVRTGRIMGATVVPFPAFQEAFIEDLQPDMALVASGADVIVAELALPRAWFDNPGLSAPTALTITDEGRIYGHAATWDSCHISFPDECVPPPRSATDYAYFHTGEVRCDDGSRVAVGHIALRGGHADLHLTAAQAAAHYDDTDSCIADITCGEDRWGIWVAGALRPDILPSEVRTAMASGISGDWRRIGGSMELIHLSSVNVPGFMTPRARIRESAGLVASAVVQLPPVESGIPADVFDSLVQRLASTVGLSREQRRRALAERVRVG